MWITAAGDSIWLWIMHPENDIAIKIAYGNLTKQVGDSKLNQSSEQDSSREECPVDEVVHTPAKWPGQMGGL